MGHPRIIAALSLPGTASLTIVPVHYALLAIVRQASPRTVDDLFTVVMGATLVASFVVAKLASRQIASLVTAARASGWAGAFLPATLASLLACAATAGTAVALPMMVAAQLLACALFILTSRRGA